MVSRSPAALVSEAWRTVGKILPPQITATLRRVYPDEARAPPLIGSLEFDSGAGITAKRL